MILNIHKTFAITTQPCSTSLYLWYTPIGVVTCTQRQNTSLCHSKHHVSAVLWNVLRSSDSRCFTEIKSGSKILAHFLTYYSYALVTLPHLAWGQNAIWIISDPTCKHIFIRPETCVQLPLAWKLYCFYFPILQLCKNSDKEFAYSAACEGWRT